MCRPCSSMRPCAPRPLAPLPPRRQPYWYTVMLSKRSRHPSPVSSKAVVMPATPPPRITTFGSGGPSGSGTVGFPQDVTEPHHEVEVQPEGGPGLAGGRKTELSGDRLTVELGQRDPVAVGQEPPVAEDAHLHVGQHDRLVAGGTRLVG